MLVIAVDTGEHFHNNAIAELPLPPGERVTEMVELDANDAPLDRPVPFQCQADSDNPSQQLLTFAILGQSGPRTRRRYRTSAGTQASECQDLVRVEDDVEHQGQASLRITTRGGTWIYHKAGGGFASLIDSQGRDWISHRPGGGAAGEYRGIPNLVHPEGYFHPGHTGCVTQLVDAGAVRATIVSRSADGQWATRWDVFPWHARLTVLEAHRPWWFLYEGTPAGRLDEAHQRVLRSGEHWTSAGESWTASLGEPAWVAFVDPRVGHSLYLARHAHHCRQPRDSAAESVTDSYWPMEQAMTVFGFGRDGLTKFHRQVPASFSVGLVDSGEADRIEAAAVACIEPVVATIEQD